MAVFRLQSQNSFPTNDNGILEGGQQLADIWRDIQGAKFWEGLLDPINPILKAELLRYGDFAQLCYDAFDNKTYSKNYGTCKHNKKSLFRKSGLANCGYKVTRYIYANTPGLSSCFGEKSSEEPVWMGFIAVCTDPNEIQRLGRRDIVVAWRGTETVQEWIQNLRDILVPATLSRATARTCSANTGRISDLDIRIEKGFLSCYTSTNEDSVRCKLSARDIVAAEITRLLTKYKGQSLSISFTGHSLGAALATLSAYDIKQVVDDMRPLSSVDGSQSILVTVFAFASPRVGNLTFARHVEEVGVKVLRLVNKYDLVPKVPGVIMNENMGWLSRLLHWLPWTYFHVGVQISLRNRKSPWLKRSYNLAHFHNLEVYLHLLDGFQGSNRSFKSLGRDLALVNKSSNLLIERLGIPSHWWQEENKGLVKRPDGKCTQPPRSPDVENKLDEFE